MDQTAQIASAVADYIADPTQNLDTCGLAIAAQAFITAPRTRAESARFCLGLANVLRKHVQLMSPVMPKEDISDQKLPLSLQGSVNRESDALDLSALENFKVPLDLVDGVEKHGSSEGESFAFGNGDVSDPPVVVGESYSFGTGGGQRRESESFAFGAGEVVGGFIGERDESRRKSATQLAKSQTVADFRRRNSKMTSRAKSKDEKQLAVSDSASERKTSKDGGGRNRADSKESNESESRSRPSSSDRQGTRTPRRTPEMMRLRNAALHAWSIFVYPQHVVPVSSLPLPPPIFSPSHHTTHPLLNQPIN
jgi:hypothetical protein